MENITHEDIIERLESIFGELNDKIAHIGSQLDRLERHACSHHEEIGIIAIQVRGLQRVPSKDDVTDYFAKKKFYLVMDE
jgi:hypothetical protein